MDVWRKRTGSIGVAAIIAVATALTASLTLPIWSAPVATAASPVVIPVGPARLLDSRPGLPTFDGISAGIGRRAAGSVTELQVAGRVGVPPSASAAILNVTAEAPSANTAITVFPCGIDRPNASNLNVPINDTRANGVFVKLGTDGKVCIATVAAVDIIIDLNGYVPNGGTPVSIDPARLLDTRPGNPTVDGRAAGIGRRGPGSTTEIRVAGRGGVPGDATAALLNVTADIPAEGTALTVYPCDISRPTASNLNVPVLDTRANNAFVRLSASGTVCVYTVAAVDIIVDVNGYVPAGAGPVRTNPSRLLDTRPGNPTVDGISAGTGRPAGGTTTVVQVAGRAGVPRDATAAFLNITSVLPTLGSLLSVFPCDLDPTSTSSINSPPGDIRANNVFVRLSPSGTACIYNVSSSDIVVDINGYVAAPPTQNCTIDGNVVAAHIPPIECASLVDLYNATGGPNWYNQSNWMSKADPCTWYGITCQNGHVVEIDLGYSNLSGALPPQISNFAQLSNLNLGGNQLTSLPQQIGALKELITLNLGRNRLTAVPAEVGDLPWLDYLDLSNNSLTSVPPELANATQLRTLYLHVNELTSVPAELGDLPRLKTLLLNTNELTQLPSRFSRLTSVSVLSLRDNQLSGDITAVFAPLKNAQTLTSLTLSGNDCLTTTDTALATWLRSLDLRWNDGC